MPNETYVTKILTELTSDYFKEIDPLKFAIEITESKDYFMAISGFYLGSSGILRVEKECFKLKKEAFIGVLAHELAHVVQRRSLWSCLSLLFTKEDKLERQADLEVIERGLGNNLYAFQKYHNKVYRIYHETDGLTKKEIIAALKERKEL